MRCTRLIDSTIVVVVNDFPQHQTKDSETSSSRINMFRQNVDTHSNATIVHHQSNIILKVESDKSCLLALGDRSRARDYVYFEIAIDLN